MDAKLKAEELVDKYIQFLPYHSKDSNFKRAVGSALIAVDEMIELAESYEDALGPAQRSDYDEFLKEVKEEINNLKS